MTIAEPKQPKTSVSLMGFLRETRAEIAKITWPTQKDITMTTVAIVVMAIVAGIFFLAVDSGLGYVISRILGMNS